MNNIFDTLIDLRESGYILSFEVNENNYLRVYQHYSEYVGGRRIYGMRKKQVLFANLETIKNDTGKYVEEMRKQLLPDNRLNVGL